MCIRDSHYCGCSVINKCTNCDNSDFIGYFDMQSSVYPNITSVPNTNGQSCSTSTEYVDVINLNNNHSYENFIKLR